MIIIQAWKHKLSAAIGILVLIVVLLWPAIPLHSLDVWLRTLFSKWPTNFLYPLFAVLLATQVALFVYDKWIAKCCRVPQTKAGAVTSVFGIVLGACPACIPVVAFFLPLSVTIAIGYYSWIILLVAIALMLYSIRRAGGFQQINKIRKV